MIPHHHREQNAHAAAMEVGNHLANSRNAARHAANQVVLVAVVDAHVRVGRPDQDRIDSAEALVEIVEVAVDGVLARDRIVEVAVVDHHLRLDETGLRPLELRAIVAGTVVADADAALVAPVADVGQPRFVLVRATELGAGEPEIFHGHAQAIGCGDLLIGGLEARVLSTCD